MSDDDQPEYRLEQEVAGTQVARNRAHLARLRAELLACQPPPVAGDGTRPPVPPLAGAADGGPVEVAEGDGSCLECELPGSGGVDPVGNRYCPTHWTARQLRLGGR